MKNQKFFHIAQNFIIDLDAVTAARVQADTLFVTISGLTEPQKATFDSPEEATRCYQALMDRLEHLS